MIKRYDLHHYTTGSRMVLSEGGLYASYADIKAVVQEAYQNGKMHGKWESSQRRSAQVPAGYLSVVGGILSKNGDD